MDERRLRSKSAVTQVERDKILVEKKKLEGEEQSWPFIEFKGKVNYVTTFIDCAIVADKILQLVERAEDTFVVGFDIEWPVNFKKGPGKVALIQMCYNAESCYLLQMSEIIRIPKVLVVLLSHPKIRLTGINIKNDLKKLGKDFSSFNKEVIMNNCIDLGVLANKIMTCQMNWSMEKLVGTLLKMKINKNRSVRISKWNAFPLSSAQIKYAANDAYASLMLYQELEKKQQNNVQDLKFNINLSVF